MTGTTELEDALRDWARVFMRRSVHEFIVAMKGAGLSTSQLSAMMRLHYHGSCPISSIGDDLGVTAAAASQITDRLAALDLVERVEDPSDRRVKQVILTDRGRRLVAQGVEARLAWTRDLLPLLPAGTVAPIVEALQRLIAAADELESRRAPAPAAETSIA